MNSDEFEQFLRWKKELSHRLGEFWQAVDGFWFIAALRQRRHWKSQPWMKPRKPFRVGFKQLQQEISPNYIELLCVDFSWHLESWAYRTDIFDFPPGDTTLMVMRLDIVQLELCSIYLKGQLRGVIEDFIDVAQGILRDIDEYYRT